MKKENRATVVPTFFRTFDDNRNNNRSKLNFTFTTYRARQTKPSSIVQKYFKVDFRENTLKKGRKQCVQLDRTEYP